MLCHFTNMLYIPSSNEAIMPREIAELVKQSTKICHLAKLSSVRGRKEIAIKRETADSIYGKKGADVKLIAHYSGRSTKAKSKQLKLV